MKYEFTSRLGNNWRDLADVLELPAHTVNTFVNGHEASAIWDWLEVRDQLNSLPSALDAIRRPDLAAILAPLAEDAPTRTGGHIWNVPARMSTFIGRENTLSEIHRELAEGRRVATTALQGLGGVGKTQLAIEYAHRFAHEYELVWWIDAEAPELIGDRLAALAVELGLVEIAAGVPAAVSAVRKHLRSTSQWLLVFDNATTPVELAPWIPQGSGHVLLTSRTPHWTQLATTVAVDVFSPQESVDFLRSNLPNLSDDEAEALAQKLGDLPLALAQASGVMAETSMPLGEYLDALASGAPVVMNHGTPVGYPRSLAAAIGIAMDRLDTEEETLGQLARLCSLLSPEPIPLADASTASSPISSFTRRHHFAHIARYGLLRIGRDDVTMHRLTQNVIANTMSDAQRAVARAQADEFMLAAQPGAPDDPTTWPAWGRLLPHLLHADIDATDNERLRWLVCVSLCYIQDRGDLRVALPLAERLYGAWRQRLGPDEVTVLGMAGKLTLCLFRLGRVPEARVLAEDTWLRQRLTLGDEHVATLASATTFGSTLRLDGDVVGAHRVWTDALERHRRVLGPDSSWALRTATCLVECLDRLGRRQEAIELGEDTLERQRNVIGENHPDTLITASNLAACLREMGELKEARELEQDTLDRREAVLGSAHPATLTSAWNLALTLYQLGDVDQARNLGAEVYAGRRAALGEDHPDTQASNSWLHRWPST